MAKVIDANIKTRLPIPVERVCEGAKHLDRVLIIGREGDELYVAASDGDFEDNILLLESAKWFLMMESEE